MYIRITPYSFDPAKEQDQLQVSEQRLVPAIRTLPGFRRYTGAVDRAAGRGVAITEWDDLAHAQDLREAVITIVRDMAEHGLHLEAAQIFEVNAHT
jgi:quinol monooxygenase YgiN